MVTLSEQQPSESVVAVFETHSDAESAVKDLGQGAFDLTTLSIVGRDISSEFTVLGFYSLGHRIHYWGKTSEFWGGLWGLLVGAAFLIIPGIGPVVIAGPVVGWVIAALEGAVVIGGLTTLGASLVTFGISKERALNYESSVKAGKFLLIAHGTPDKIRRAIDLLRGQHTETIERHLLSPEPAAAA